MNDVQHEFYVTRTKNDSQRYVGKTRRTELQR